MAEGVPPPHQGAGWLRSVPCLSRFLHLYVYGLTLFLAFISCQEWDEDSRHVRVDTVKGPVQGRRVMTGSDRVVQEFLGIPYAKPPLRHLRYRYPEPVDAWTKVYNATKLPNSCVQLYDFAFQNFSGTQMWNPNTNVSEDCLYLNVWVPHPRPKNAAVMVWIYGGGFYSGSSTLKVYDGKILAAHGHVIVVSFQYRVGALGFLAFNRDDAPGNMGMMDQQLALKWVKENIEAFGGDSDRITLFGESAGSASVSFHLLSEGSRPYFHRAIMQSGTATMPWATMSHEVAKLRGLRLAEALRCPHSPNDMDSVMDCLRTADPWSIVKNEWVTLLGIAEFPFVPVVDGKFLTEPPYVSMGRSSFYKTNILIGSNLNEGTYFLIYFLNQLLSLSEEVHISSTQFRIAIKELFLQYNSFSHDAITFQYTDWEQPESAMALLRGLDAAVADHSFVCHSNDFAQAYARSGEQVYMYFFTHRSSQSPWPQWMGAMHADEINYEFGEPLAKNSGYTRKEKQLSREMIRYWSNFAETGNPNLASSGKWTNTEWIPHTVHGREYLQLTANSSGLTTGHGPRTKFCAFWKFYLPQLDSSTKGISEAERQWKLQFHEWNNRYIVDWKNQFDKYVANQEKTCG